MRTFLLVAALVCAAAPRAHAGQSLPAATPPFAAPAFDLAGEDGRHYRLDELRGKVVVLNFWATWCPPCRKEMPSMERARALTEGESIVILGINVGEDADTIFEFTGRYPVGFPLLMDRDARVIKQYPVTGLPTTYVIDPRGQVRYRAVGSREWDDPEMLERLRALLR